MELPAAFSQRIKSTPLTAKEALVAEYILNNFLSVCYVSTSELARILGVSDATVSRTSKVLGYRSFLDLQKEIQSFVSQKADYAQRGFFPPIERLHTHQSLDAKENIVAQFSTLTYKNLQSVLEKNSEESIHAAADLLCSAASNILPGAGPPHLLLRNSAFDAHGLSPVSYRPQGASPLNSCWTSPQRTACSSSISIPMVRKSGAGSILPTAAGRKSSCSLISPPLPSPILLMCCCWRTYTASAFSTPMYPPPFFWSFLMSSGRRPDGRDRHQAPGSFEPLLRAEQALIFSYGISPRTEGGLNMLTPLKKEERQHEKSTLSCPCTGALYGAVQRLRH